MIVIKQKNHHGAPNGETFHVYYTILPHINKRLAEITFERDELGEIFHTDFLDSDDLQQIIEVLQRAKKDLDTA